MSLLDLLPNNNVASGAKNAVASKFNPVNMIANGRAYLDTKVNKYLVKPKTAHGIGGFVFDYETETVVTLQSEVTEHYTEQNTFIMDHIAHKPARITLRGLVGEIVKVAPQGVTGALAILQGKLSTLPALLGKYTPGGLKNIQGAVTAATNAVNKIDNVINRAQNIVGLFAGSTPGPTRQKRAYMELYALWMANVVFTVETPYKYFDSMVIEQISFTQNEETKFTSEISATLKEVRFAAVESQDGLSTTDALQQNDGRSAQNRQGQNNQGRAVCTEVDFLDLSLAPGMAP